MEIDADTRIRGYTDETRGNWILACVAGVRKGRGRELERETTREGGEERLQASHYFRHPAY